MESNYIDPKTDFAFKKLFGKESNKDLLIAIINAVLKNQLHRPVVDVTIVPSNLDPEIKTKKQSYVDVLCHDQDGCPYIVEMQVAKDPGFEKRAQFYASRTFANQMDKREDYRNPKQVIFLSLLNSIIFPNKSDYKSEHITIDKNTRENNLDLISFTFVELPKFDQQNNKAPEALTLEEKFYYFLLYANQSGPDIIKKLTGKDYIIKRAFEVLNKSSFTEKELLEYREFEDYQRDSQIREDRIKAEGKAEVVLQVAKQMLADRESIEKIKRYTGLTAQQIGRLKSEIEENE